MSTRKMPAIPKGHYEYFGKAVNEQMPEAARELYFIQHGGKWKNKIGGTFGNGLLYHFLQAVKFIWPEIEQHRWFLLFVDEWLSHRYIGVLGPRNSGKSLNATICHLVDYYANPTCTTTLVCSTTRERLEDRIWGEIKKFHRIAKSRFNFIPGHLIEGRQRIVTDDRDEASEGRDFRNGLTAVACLKGSSYVGISSFQGIKNKRVRLCGDELACFVAGTEVDTPSGPVQIQNVKPGDLVFSAFGVDRVAQTFSRISNQLVRVRTKDGRVITCTAAHPFFTQDGWKKAIELNETSYILSSYEAMCCLWCDYPGHRSQPVLQGVCPSHSEVQGLCKSLSIEVPNIKPDLLRSVLQHEMDALNSGNPKGAIAPTLARSETVSCETPGSWTSDCRTKPELDSSETTSDRKENIGNPQAHGAQAKGSWGKRNRSNQSRVSANDIVPQCSMELRHQDGKMERQRIPADLQSGLGFPQETDGNRGRRSLSWSLGQPQTQGQEEGCVSKGAWVESVEVLQSGDSGESPASAIVYNLSVERHPSFSVGGLLVHNSLPKTFIDAIATLDVQGDIKVTGMGNPAQTTDALGILCEPHVTLGGWEGGIDQTPKTKVWRTRFEDGVCIQFPGSDSPNMDAKVGDPAPYPFLMTREVMERDMLTWGKDDWHYTMFNEGRMPRGQGSRRVITRQLCLKQHAMEEPVWLNSNLTYITALDAAYRAVGGDRCVLMRLAYGSESYSPDTAVTTDGLINQNPDGNRHKVIIALLDTIVIPIAASEFESPEDQIVMFVKQKHTGWSLGPESLFYDAGMRTSLVTAFARLWSPKVNSVDFGGKPSERRVSRDIDVSCRDYYANFVTELWYSVRLAIEAGQVRGLSEDVVAEGCLREWTNVAGNKIKVETKDDMKLKTGRSPDLFDALVTGMEGARQRGFVIARLADPEVNSGRADWKRKLKEQAEKFRQAHDLNYSA